MKHSKDIDTKQKEVRKKEMAEKKATEVMVVEGVPQILSAAQVKEIALNTPDDSVKYRKGRGGLTFAYVETNYVIRQLNRIFGFAWEDEVIKATTEEEALKTGQITVLVKLTVWDSKGHSISKTGFGGADIKWMKGRPHNAEGLVDLADDYKAASSDGLKKAASKFGIALDVYSGKFTPPKGTGTASFEVGSGTGSKPTSDFPTPTSAQSDGSGAYYVSPKQQRYLLGTAGSFKKDGKYVRKEDPITPAQIKEAHKLLFGDDSLSKYPDRDSFDKFLTSVQKLDNGKSFQGFIDAEIKKQKDEKEVKK